MGLRLTAQATVQAPPAAAWAVIGNVVDWPAWTPTVQRVQALDAAALAPGHRYRIVQPRLAPLVWTVVRLDAPRAFCWEARAPGLHLLADHRVEQGADGAAVLRLEFRFEGPLGTWAGRLWRRRTQQYLDAEARAFQVRVQAIAAPAAALAPD